MNALAKHLKHCSKAALSVLAVFLSVVLVIGLMPSFALSQGAYAATAETNGEDATDQEQATTDTPVDITEQWSAGEFVIDAAGTYVLSDDVTTDGMLTIAVPAGDAATLDFCGHTVTVNGNVYAGIDASPSRGSVTITDSAYSDAVDNASDEERAQGVIPQATLSVEATKANGNVFALLADFGAKENAEDEAASEMHNSNDGDDTDSLLADIPTITIENIALQANLNTVDAEAEQSTHDSYAVYINGTANGDSQFSDVYSMLTNISLVSHINEISMSDEEASTLSSDYGERVLDKADVGTAYGIGTTVKSVILDGVVVSDTQSTGAAYDLYGTQERAFSFGAGFLLPAEVSIVAANNDADVIIADYSMDLDIRTDVLPLLVNAANSNIFTAADGLISCTAVAYDTSEKSAPDAVDTDVSVPEEEEEVPEETPVFSRTTFADSIMQSPLIAAKNLCLSYESSTFENNVETEELDPRISEKITPLADDGQVYNLNEMLIEANADAATNITLDNPGIYYLSQDYKGTIGRITSNSSGVVIDFCGHTLVSNAIYVGNAKGTVVSDDLSLISTDADYAHGQTGGKAIQGNLIIQSGNRINSDSTHKASSLNIDHLNITQVRDGTVVSNAISCSLIQLYSGIDVNITSSNISYDLSNVTSYTANNNAYYSAFAAINGYCSSLNIEDSTVKIIGCNLESGGSMGAAAISMTSSGGSLTIGGSTDISAYAPNGSAYAIFFDNTKSCTIEEGSSVTLEATSNSPTTAGDFSFGLATGRSCRAESVFLNGEIEFKSDAKTNAYALGCQSGCTDAQDCVFVVDSGFSASSPLTVLAGLNYATNSNSTNYINQVTGIADDANTVDTYFASFSDDVGNEMKDNISSLLTNSYNPGVCEIAGDMDGVYFESTSGCEASLWRNGVYVDEYRSFARAVTAAQNEDVIKLEKNLNKIASFDKSDAADQSYSVDLNGYQLAAFSNTSDADVTLFSSANEQLAMTGAKNLATQANPTTGAILQSGTGTLTVQNIPVSISMTGTNDAFFGARVNRGGTLKLENVNFTLVGNSRNYGVYAQDNASVEVAGGGISLAHQSDNVGYGLKGENLLLENGATVNVSGSGQLRNISGDSSCSCSVTEDSSLLLEADANASEAYNLVVDSTGDAFVSDSSLVISTAEDITEDAASAITAWNISTGSASSQLSLDGECFISRSGELSGGNISLGGSPMKLGSDFSLAAGGDVLLTVGGSELTNDVVAQPLDEDFPITEEQALLFTAVSDPTYAYAGWEIKIDDAGRLVYVTDVVARIGDTYYNSLTRAVAAASSGDTVYIVRDATSTAVTVNKSITLDLAGYNLSIVSVDGYGIQVSSEEESGGRLTVTDSGESRGLLTFDLRPSGTLSSFTSGGAQNGFALSSNAAVTVSDCNIDVHCSGTGEAWALTGIYAAQGTSATDIDDKAAILIENNANIFVSATDPDAEDTGTAGARAAYGIYTDCLSQKHSIEVDDGCTLVVSSSLPEKEMEGNPDPTLEGTLSTEVWLRKVTYDVDSAWYAEVCERFLSTASYDSATKVYHVNPMSLSDGTYVWAYSDEVSSDNLGDRAYIVPTNVYVMTNYDYEPNAVGIAAGENESLGWLADVDVHVQGNISATSAYGNAYAVSVRGTASYDEPTNWVLDGATLSATSTRLGTYHKIDNSIFGVMESFGAEATGGGQVELHGVADAYTEAVGVNQLLSDAQEEGTSPYHPTVTLDGSIDISTKGPSTADLLVDDFMLGADFSAAGALSVGDRNGCTTRGEVFATADYLSDGDEIDAGLCNMFTDVTGVYSPAVDGISLIWGDLYTPASDVNLTFSAARDAEGNSLGNTVIAVTSGEKLADEDVLDQVPKAESYYDATTAQTFVFVGWQVQYGSTSYKRVWDPECLGDYSSTLDATLSAYYVSVGSEEQLVEFKVENYLFAYAVSNGVSPTYAAAYSANQAGSPSTTPNPASEKEAAPGETWFLDGWHTGWVDVRGNNYPSVNYPDGSLPAAEGGAEAVCYTAVLSCEISTVSVTLHYYKDWDGSGTWTYNNSTGGGIGNRNDPTGTIYGVTYGADINDIGTSKADPAFDEVELIDFAQADSSGNWTAYTFLGWSTRMDDRQPLVGDELPKAGEQSQFYAIYSNEPMQMQVSFVDTDEDGNETVIASGDVNAYTSTTLYDAATAAGVADVRSGSTGNGLPVPTKEGKVFAGWAQQPGGSAVSNPALSYVLNASTVQTPELGSGRITGSASYYAVWVDEGQVTVTLYGCTEDNWSDKTFGTTRNEVIDMEELESNGYVDPWKMGYAFVGWNTSEDGSGSYFDIRRNEVTAEDTFDLYAQYVDLAKSANCEDSKSVDVSATYINSQLAIGAQDVVIKLASADSADARIVVNTTGYVKLCNYSFEIDAVQSDTSSVAITKGFGTIDVSVPLPAAAQGRDTIYAFILGADGVANPTLCSIDNDILTFSLSGSAGYSATDEGNIVLAYALTSSEQSLNNYKTQVKAQLQEQFNSYYEGDYADENYSKLCSILEKAIADIDAATSMDEVLDIGNQASEDMANVESYAGLDSAKAAALAELANAYAGYDSSNYTAESWNKLVDAYESARSAINSAKTASAASAAASDGIIAMASITADGLGVITTPATYSNGGSNGDYYDDSNGSGSGGGSSGSGSPDDGGGTTTTTTTYSNGGSNGGSSGSNGSGNSGLSGSGNSGSSGNSGLNGTGSGASSSGGSDSGLTGSSSQAASGLAQLVGTGEIAAAMLGGEVVDIDDDLAAALGVEAGCGVLVTEVDRDGPLYEAGIEPGDIITAINGTPVRSVADLEEVLSTLNEGDVATFTVLRDGEEMTFTVTLGAPPSLDDASLLAAGTGEDSGDDGSSGGILEWLSDNIVPVVIVGIIILAAIAALVWWLLRRRRNRSDDEEGEDEDELWDDGLDALNYA